MAADDPTVNAPDRSLVGVRPETDEATVASDTADDHGPADGTVDDGFDGAADEDDTAVRLGERRRAVAELGESLRHLVSNAVTTDVDVETLRRVTRHVDELASALGAEQRDPHRPASVDDLDRGQRMYNPIVGAGNPVAPPVRIEYVDGAAVGTCVLDHRYEGPFTYAHGGVSALLLDQVMGYAAAAAGHPSVTGRLEIRYRDAVPLGEPLVIRAHLVDVLGVRAAIHGTIALAAHPDDALVQAEGRFLALRAEQTSRLFGHVDMARGRPRHGAERPPR